MYIVSAKEMRDLDRTAIETIGIPSLVLMENAGRAVAEAVLDMIRDTGTDKPWIVLAGKGNNGADGVVAARHLQEAGIGVHVLYIAPPESLTGEAAVQRDIAFRLGLPHDVYAPGGVRWEQYGGIIDALLGTGTGGAPREPYASLIREANESGLPVVSVDIPSGLDADTGNVYSPCIRADRTVTFAFLKRGLAQYPGKQQAGECIVVPIGIPERIAAEYPVRTYLADRTLFRRSFAVDLPLARPANTHKGHYGHVLIAAGSLDYSGAGLLAASAALRAGSGLVTWALPQKLKECMIGHRPEIMMRGIEDGGSGEWTPASADALVELSCGKDAMAVGPGLSRFAGDTGWLRILWESIACPLVLDADALNILADARDFGEWPKRAFPTVMTPHPGEMARLAGLTVKEVEQDRIELARRYAAQHQVILVLKGAATVTATPQGDVYVNTTGNPGMATGGSGDVLTGIIVSLIGQGLPAEQAAVIGVYLHGEAGDRAAGRRLSPASLLAGDIVDAL